jgi:RsiW-degrading membrane proteinase PrsW (M82 family)
MVLRVFFLGMLVAIPAVFLEIGIFKTFGVLNLPPLLLVILNTFIGVALVEEFLKYLVVRNQVLSHKEYDEPIDAMLYMIISALGFAALENILILFQLGPGFLLSRTLEISIFRFLGATVLHALASGTIGYFLSLSFYKKGRRTIFVAMGLIIAAALHGFYNLFIMKGEGNLKVFVPLIILMGLAIFVAFGIKKLQKISRAGKV